MTVEQIVFIGAHDELWRRSETARRESARFQDFVHITSALFSSLIELIISQPIAHRRGWRQRQNNADSGSRFHGGNGGPPVRFLAYS